MGFDNMNSSDWTSYSLPERLGLVQAPRKPKGKRQNEDWSQQEPDKGKGKRQREDWSQQEPGKGKGKTQRDNWSQHEPDKGKGKRQREHWSQQEADGGKGKRQRENWSQADMSRKEDAWQTAPRGPASTGGGPRTPPAWATKEEPGLTTQAPANPRSMGTWATRPSRPAPAASRGW